MAPPEDVTFTGVVLTGGGSTRFGRDKALVEVDGTPMAARVGAALRAAGAHEVLAVGGDEKALRSLGFRWVADRWPGEGPLGAVITGLAAVRTPTAVVCACDLPAADAAVIRRLRASADGVAVLLPVVGGRSQPLLAVYPAVAVQRLEEAFLAGARSMRAGLDVLAVTEVVVDDPTGAFADVDRPGDLPPTPTGGQAPETG